MLNREQFEIADGRRAPIRRWLELLASPPRSSDLDALAEVYAAAWPILGEIILTGACEFECVHCIYPSDYGRLNSVLSPKDWTQIFASIHADLGIETFVYGGRSVTRSGIAALESLRVLVPDARIGLIDNGISMVPHRESLRSLGLQWVDISFDGDEIAHDLQRRRPGSFRAALDGARWLKQHRVAPRVNVLACLTTINVEAVQPMIAALNREGFKNFFITPVSVAKGYRPSMTLIVDCPVFVTFVRDLRTQLDRLEDAHIEIELYDARYLQYLLGAGDDLGRPSLDRDHLTWRMADGPSYFAINYYPLSLSGTRELIINSNGDVILPKAMAKGIVTGPDVFGNLLQRSPVDVVKGIPHAAGFNFYMEQLHEERRLLGARIAQLFESDTPK